MAYKFFVLAAVVAVVRCELAVAPAPVVAKVSEAINDPLPQYSFGYDVQDALTGDSKSQIETRNGNVVRGQYSLNDPDGTRRIVDYTADPVNGFNAVVRRAPLRVAPAVQGVPVNPAIEPLAEPVPSKVVAAKAARVEAVRVNAPLAARGVAAPLVANTVPAAVGRIVAPAPAPLVSAPILQAAPLAYTSQAYSISSFGPIAYTLL